jgi:ABC-type uncharacterized transport system auxiliary subunit
MSGGRGPSVVINSFATAAGYDTARLAFRTSEYELQYYGYRQWAAEPSRLLTEMIIRQFQATRLFSEVSSMDKLRDPEIIVDGTVEAIEEVDTRSRWQARLAMSFIVRNGENEKILLRHSFDLSRPCSRRHPDEIAHQISQILAEQSQKLARRILKVMR